MSLPVAAYARIGAKAIGKATLVIVLGTITCLATFLIALALLNNNEGGGPGHGSGIGALIGLFVLFAEEFWTAVLLFSAPLLFFYFITLAMKTLTMTSVSGIWEHRLGDFVKDKVAHYLGSAKLNQQEWVRSGADAALLRVRLLDALRKDVSVNGVQRRALRFGFRKLRLDGIDWNSPKLDLPAAISERLHAGIGEAIRPSGWWLGAPLLLQAVLVILAVVFDHT